MPLKKVQSTITKGKNLQVSVKLLIFARKFKKMRMKKVLLLALMTLVWLGTHAQPTTESTAMQPQQQVLKFGYLSYDSVLTQTADYAVVRQTLADLKAKFEAEQKRVENDFNQKYEEFLDGQKDFPPTILRKRQTELRELMERNVAFRQQALDELRQTELRLMAPLHQRLQQVLAGVARLRSLAFILNTDSDAVPFINPAQGEDLNQTVADALQ